MKFTRRDVIRTGAGAAAGAGRQPVPRLPGLRPGRADIHARAGRHAAPAALVALRAGRRGPVARQHQALHRRDRRAGARRQGKLGGHPPEGRGRRQCRLRPRPHAGLVRRRRTNIPTSCSTSPTSPTISATNMAAGTTARRATPRATASSSACRWRRSATPSSTATAGSRKPASPNSRRTPQASSSSARRCRRTAIRPASRMATASATATTTRTGCCGAMAARWSTRAARSPSTAPRR